MKYNMKRTLLGLISGYYLCKPHFIKAIDDFPATIQINHGALRKMADAGLDVAHAMRKICPRQYSALHAKYNEVIRLHSNNIYLTDFPSTSHAYILSKIPVHEKTDVHGKPLKPEDTIVQPWHYHKNSKIWKDRIEYQYAAINKHMDELKKEREIVQ